MCKKHYINFFLIVRLDHIRVDSTPFRTYSMNECQQEEKSYSPNRVNVCILNPNAQLECYGSTQMSIYS